MPAVNLTVYWPPLYRLILAEVLRHRWRLGYLTFFACCFSCSGCVPRRWAATFNSFCNSSLLGKVFHTFQSKK